MAMVTGLMSATVTDSYGIAATTNAFIEADDTKTIAQLVTDGTSWINLVQGLSQGKVVKGKISVDLAGTGTAPAGDVEKGGLFNFNNASDPYAQGFYIPDIEPTVLNASGLIDLTNVSVTNFITFMTTAHTVITVVTKGVRALTTLKDALISFRKHRKPLERKTKEV